MWIVISSKYCKWCNRSFELDELKLGKEAIPDGERIYFICPLCGKAIEDELINGTEEPHK